MKVLICASEKPALIEKLQDITKTGLINGAEVHLLHIVQQQVYLNEFASYSWPTEEMFVEIKKTSEKSLDQIAKKISTNVTGAKFKSFCKLDFSPKKYIVDYIKEHKIDLVVVATEGKKGIQGLFAGSTSEYLIKYSPCPIYVIR